MQRYKISAYAVSDYPQKSVKQMLNLPTPPKFGGLRRAMLIRTSNRVYVIVDI